MTRQQRYPVSDIDRLRMGLDGKGIRTLILMQGCPLRCKYCFNSYTWEPDEITRMMTAEELFEEVDQDYAYQMATRGGVTFGGGEPLLYPELIREFRKLLDADLTIYVETSLSVPWENIRSTTEAVEKYYVDIKTMDEEIYRAYTGGRLETALKNLKNLLLKKGSDGVVVRIPEIPGLTDMNDVLAYKDKLQMMGFQQFDLLEYMVRGGVTNE